MQCATLSHACLTAFGQLIVQVLDIVVIDQPRLIEILLQGCRTLAEIVNDAIFNTTLNKEIIRSYIDTNILQTLNKGDQVLRVTGCDLNLSMMMFFEILAVIEAKLYSLPVSTNFIC